MRKEKLVKMALYLTVRQAEALRKIAEQTDIPVSRLIRQGVELLLEKYKKKEG